MVHCDQPVKKICNAYVAARLGDHGDNDLLWKMKKCQRLQPKRSNRYEHVCIYVQGQQSDFDKARNKVKGKFLSLSIAIKDNAIMDFSLTLATGWRTFSHLWFHGPCSVMFGRHWRARCWFYIQYMNLINFVGLTALFQHTSMFQTKSTGAVKGWVQTEG